MVTAAEGVDAKMNDVIRIGRRRQRSLAGVAVLVLVRQDDVDVSAIRALGDRMRMIARMSPERDGARDQRRARYDLRPGTQQRDDHRPNSHRGGP